MEEISINVTNLSKVYKLYEKPIDRLKETLSLSGRSYHRDFFALNNINLKINKGETVGIIGKNGAGKSTLLKIITGVLAPTSGKIVINGRISSLLELGAGFNPEYTGLENIYLNGTIMGMTKEEIEERIPDILNFADIGDFVFQPVKTYSSGMYVRLAFSVAINVNPDILIVDEALAVGDARFQAKCYQKLAMLKDQGITILFVSHDITTVKNMCSKAYLIDNGMILDEGDPKDVCISYFKLIFPEQEEKNDCIEEKHVEGGNLKSLEKEHRLIFSPESDCVNTFGVGGIQIDKLVIDGINIHDISGGEQVSISVSFTCDEKLLREKMATEDVINNIISGVSVSNVKGDYLFGMTTYDKNVLLPINDNKKYEIKYSFRFPDLITGEYLLNTAVALGTQEHHIQLKWLDGLEVLKVNQKKKYIYGIFYNEYDVRSDINEL